MFSPYKRSIKFIQEIYKENDSNEIVLSKAELNDLLYEGVSTQPAIVVNTRRVLVAKGLIGWNQKTDRCVLHLNLIKQEKL